MREKELENFETLKKKIVEVMQQSFPGINPSISEWKGQEITDFQEDLLIKVNANISEKWFYTHMKSGGTTLPRIDMLNILSKYTGYANWDEFVFRNGQKILIPVMPAGPAPEPPPPTVAKTSANRYFMVVPLLALAIVATLFGIYSLFSTREYRFTFVDADTRETIIDPQTEIILLQEGESPVHAMAGKDGSYTLKTAESRIRMVVKAPCYLPDTVTRILRKFGNEEVIMLKADDYALMIHYLSTTNVGDWEMRRKRLGELIDDGAVICQVSKGEGTPVTALFNKQEFIDLLTMPSGTLKNIEVIGSRLKDDKIVLLRFRIREGKP